jgi:hypothetical protein
MGKVQTMTSRLTEIRKRLEAATPQTKQTTADRIYHSDGDINYEINDEYHLVAFREDNHEVRMRAKFNAELYAHCRTDIEYLLSLVEEAREAISDSIARADDYGDSWNSKPIREFLARLERGV